jgi:hypothetical protein
MGKNHYYWLAKQLVFKGRKARRKLLGVDVESEFHINGLAMATLYRQSEKLLHAESWWNINVVS